MSRFRIEKKPDPPQRAIAWFSCGAASAVASKYAVDKYGDRCEVIYCDVRSDEHPDNHIFFRAVEKWIGRQIKIISSSKYKSVNEVFAKTRYMAGINGARCTTEMKKKPRFEYQRADDIHIFGFTSDELRRVKRLEGNNPELLLDWVLVDAEVTKQDCYDILETAGIEIPTMYKLGYNNNNCIGCVKASGAGYWNMIRRDFPKIFKLRCKQSRELGVRLTRLRGKRIFLDELPKDYIPADEPPEDISCGPECQGLPNEAPPPRKPPIKEKEKKSVKMTKFKLNDRPRKSPDPKTGEWSVFHGDSRKVSMTGASGAALLVTSPPYFKAGQEYQTEAHTLGSYLLLLHDVFERCYKLLKPGGRIAVNIAGVFRNPYIPLHHEVNRVLADIFDQQAGEIIWFKGHALGTSTAWGSWQRPSAPSLRDNHEYILVHQKKSNKVTKGGAYVLKGPKGYTIPKDLFVSMTRSVWEISPAKDKIHPCIFPPELANRLIQLYSFPGDIILDPFCGVSTAGTEAVKLGRHYVGVDKELRYVEEGQRRLRRLSGLPATPGDQRPAV